MRAYTTHHIAGRLRLKLLEIKNRPQLAARAETALGSLDGVTSVKANSLTGSLLIQYDAGMLSLASLRHALQPAGFAAAFDDAPEAGQFASSALAEKIVEIFLEKIISRSAVLIVGTLL